MTDFEGWVPNATGNISFSAIGDPLSTGLLMKQHLPLPAQRWIVLCQNRRNRDRQVPRRLANLLRSVVGPRYADRRRVTRYETLTYSLFARSMPVREDAEGALDGTITISFPGTVANDRALRQVNSTAGMLNERTRQLRAGQEVEPPPDGIWDGAVAMLRDNSVFDCTFRMLRNGKCFFQVDSTRHKLDDTTMHWLMSQCYYFLKDAVHQHYHHRQATDAIIELSPALATPDWRFRTLRNLYRKVISLRRSRSERMLSDALGVMTYANVFADIFREKDFGFDGVESPSPPRLPIYHPEELQSSITIRRDTARRDYDRRKSDVQYWIGAFLTGILIDAAIYDHLAPGSLARQLDDAIYRILSDDPVTIIAPAIIIYVVYRLLVGAKDPAENRVVRWLYRLFAWFSQSAAIAIALALTLALVAGAAFSIWMITRSL